MLKPSYIFLWIIIHLTAVELPEKIRKRGEPQLPVTELIKENRYPEASKYYKSLKKIEEPTEYRSLALSFHRLGYYDTASSLMGRLFKRFPKKVTPEDQLFYAELLRKKGQIRTSDSLIKFLKINTDYSARLIFNQFEDASFLQVARENEFLRVNPQHYSSESKHDVYLPLKDPAKNIWYYHEKQPFNSGLLNNNSMVDGKPYGRIKKIQNLEDTLISEGVLLPQQLWNRHLELNDIDRYGNMFVSMNIPTVNDQDKFNLNVRRMYYDSSVSKVKFQSIGFEKFNYNTSGLSLSPSGTNCLFTSDMYGGFGMADLWFGTMQYNKEGKVSVQNYFNLGEAINTEKSDFDASFITENIIAFVSDGHMGFGGRDLYFFHLQTNRLINAGEYVNSRFDEFAPRFIDGKLFYSSNRLSNRSDIYSFNLNVNALESMLNPQENSQTASYNVQGQMVTKTDRPGGRTSTFDEVRIQLKDDDPRKYNYTRGVDFLLFPDSVRLNIINNLDSNADYRDFRFMTLDHPYDHIVIEADYERELILLSKLLKKRSDWGVLIRSHTDSKGDKSVNKNLSQERADFISDYLEYLGVNKTQLRVEGAGETLPLNHCYNDAPCTEEEYAKNRRTELLLLRLK